MYKKYLLEIKKFWKTSNLSSNETCLGKLNIKFSAGQFLSGIFYGRMDVQICTFTRFIRTKLRFQMWTFTRFTRFTSSVRSVQRSRISISTWNILGANRQIFTPLHSNASSRFRCVSNTVSKNLLLGYLV